jgi:hypothetical protein
MDSARDASISVVSLRDGWKMTHLRICVLALIVLMAVACIGDRSHDATIQNDANFLVTVYPYGRGEARFKHVLAPAESARENLLTTDTHPGGYVTVVEAVNDAQVIVFCHRYTYGELQELGWKIRIKSGQLDCG